MVNCRNAPRHVPTLFFGGRIWVRPYVFGRRTRRPYSPFREPRALPAAGKRYGRQRRGGTARPAAPPRLPAAFALPAHENEVKFPLKNRADGKTVAAVVVAPAHAAQE